MPNRGGFIAIEGGDGSGKATQTEILHNYLTQELGLSVLKMSFPQYDEPSSYYATKYLNGAFGSADDVPADLGALPFAIDRFAAKPLIETQLEQPGGIVITDRYVASNLAHQGTKVRLKRERLAFYKRTLNMEYGILGIPRPVLNIVLLLPTEIAQTNVDKKSKRTYTPKTRDIHEADASHLDRAKANYEELCKIYPREFTAVQCLGKDGSMRSIDDIQSEIRKIVKKLI